MGTHDPASRMPGGDGGRQGRLPLSQVQCFECKEFGHYKTSCPKLMAKQQMEAARNMWDLGVVFSSGLVLMLFPVFFPSLVLLPWMSTTMESTRQRQCGRKQVLHGDRSSSMMVME